MPRMRRAVYDGRDGRIGRRDQAGVLIPRAIAHGMSILMRMNDDPALDWFLEDAKRQGLTLTEYERRYAIILDMDSDRPSPAAQRIRRHEVSGGLMTDDAIAIARQSEERRLIGRRSSWATLPPDDCE